MNRRLTALCLLLIAALAGCSDDETVTEIQADGAIAGRVTDLSFGFGLGDANVVLLRDDFGVQGVGTTGADGAYSIGDVPPGSYLLYVLLADYTMAEPGQSRVEVASGEDLVLDVRLVSDPVALYDYAVRGRITDAVTGDPVAGAWIASISLGEAGNSVRYLTENRGTTVAVSGADGSYSLPMYGVTEFFEGPVIGLSPISVGRDGYRPRTFAGEGPDHAYEPWLPGGLLPAPAPGDSVLVLDIALEPVQDGGPAAEEVGTIRGRIVHDGEPQADVMVTLTLMTLADRDTVFAPDKVAVDGGFVRSGADGSFAFEAEPGFYALRAGLLPDDGWCRDSGLSSLEVVAGGIHDVGDIGVGPAIAPVAPQPGETVELAAPHILELSWTPHEGADRYRIVASFYTRRMDTIGYSDTTTFAWNLDGAKSLESLPVRWKVFAETRDEMMNYWSESWFEVPATCTLVPAGKD